MSGLIRLIARLLAAISLAGAAKAFEPELPIGARLTAERATVLDRFEAPVAGFDGTLVPNLTLDGAIARRVWRLDSPGLTPLQVLAPLRTQLEAQGYEIVFECAARTCGGFDFRFAIEVLPGPNMYVNLSRFMYLTAFRGDPMSPDKAAGVLVSVSAESAYLQIITADRAVQQVPDVLTPTEADLVPVEVAEPTLDLEDELLERGYVVLEELDFSVGTTDLSNGPFASLEALALALENNPDVRVALVGHTDTIGSLQANISVSRARARSVRDRLVSQYSVESRRLDAEGMGYLSPVAPNTTEDGRALNRRVEAVLLP